ncbi:ribosome-recycling factor, mitochondrial-like isoform X2 [Scylla paramamosain]|uniref:ribosome-recycling factor, mitochondrial-like isoform X2 n=1 Tax=Scylla paramamosain TaxID=85552 RepID=UPI00308359EC
MMECWPDDGVTSAGGEARSEGTMALLGPAVTGRMRLALSPSWSVVRAVCQSRGPWNNLTQATPTPALPPHILLPPPASLTLVRGYAKGKDKKGKAKQQKAVVSEEEMNEVVNVDKMREHLSQLVEALKQDYIKTLSIRTAAGSIESLPVQLEGDEYPLNEVAQVSRKSPQVVIINAAAFPQALPGILAAIRDTGMNLNPQQEGTTVIVPVPKVTREHRENMAKAAKVMFNRCKDQLRDAQNLYIRKVKNKEGQFSEDLLFNVQLRIRELAEEHMHEAESMMQAKQKELLKTS